MNKKESVESVLKEFRNEQNDISRLRKEIVGDDTELADDLSWIFFEPLNWDASISRIAAGFSGKVLEKEALVYYNEWLVSGQGALRLKGINIPRPPSGMSLEEYLHFLIKEVVKNTFAYVTQQHAELWDRKVKNFVHWLRAQFVGSDLYTLDNLFYPGFGVHQDQKKARNGRVVAVSEGFLVCPDRCIAPVTYRTAAETVQKLVAASFEGKVRERRTIQETLAFLLLCFPTAYRGLSVLEKDLLSISVCKLEDSEDLLQSPSMGIKTAYGMRTVPISQYEYRLLIALGKGSGEIFTKPLRMLLRCLQRFVPCNQKRPTFKNFLNTWLVFKSFS